MAAPQDVQALLALLAEIGIEPQVVALAEKHLLADANDEGRWVGIAAEFRQAGRNHASLAVYDAALKRFPQSFRLWGNRGVLLREWKRYDEAVESLKKAIAIKPDYAHAMESLGAVYERQRDYPQAIVWYTKALAIEPGRVASMNNLANCCRFSGDRERAQEWYRRTLAADPNHLDALFNLAALYYEDQQFELALETVERFLSLAPDDAGAQQLHAEILKRPQQPRPLQPQEPPEPVVVRASANYGWTGTIADAEMTVAPPPESEMPAGHFPDFEEVAGMSREEAAPHVGYRTWDIAHLWELVAQGVQETEVPAPQDWPLLFISYKWESDAHNAWVEKLARDLAARGYDVTFDRFAQKERQPPTVPELVSRLVGCNLFVPVLTELYRRRVEVESGVITLDEDSWVFDEWQVALRLAEAGRMKFLGLWRSGPVLPRPFTAESVYDFREDARYSEMLDKVFPPLRVMVVGLRVSGTHRAIGPVLRSQTDAIIRQLEETGEFEKIGLMKVDR